MALKLGKCRLCLKLGDFYSIFTVDNSLQLAEMVMECTRLKIYEGDGLPDKICSECIQKLSSAFIFKQQCERADVELRRNYVPPPGFSVTSPQPNRQSSDSAFSNHTELSNQTKPSFIDKPSPASRKRKKSQESIDNASFSSRSQGYRQSTKRVDELKKASKRTRREKSETRSLNSDYEDNSYSQYSPDVSDSDEPLLSDYTCKVCNKKFKGNIALSNHMRWHKNKSINERTESPSSSFHNSSFQNSSFKDSSFQNSSFKDSSFKDTSIHNDDEDTKLGCERCGKTFKLQIMLKRHLEQCGKSPQKSPNKELLVALEPIDKVKEQPTNKEPIDAIKRFDCEMCGTKFKTLDNLDKHMRMAHAAVLRRDRVEAPTYPTGKVPVPCIFCQTKFDDYHRFVAHFNNCPKKEMDMSLECPVCHKQMTKRNGYLIHLKTMHFEPRTPVAAPLNNTGSPQEVFECRVCNKTMGSQELLIKHLAAHVSNIEEVDEKSQVSSYENDSSEDYKGPVTHKCDYCDKRFKYLKALDTHIQSVHTGSHMASVKTEPPDKPSTSFQSYKEYDDSDSEPEGEDLTCDICEKMFSYKRLLIHHKRTKHNMSSGTKRAKILLKDCSVRCLICDVEMKVSDINEHNQKHTTANIKPRNLYTCVACGEKFKSCSGLAEHIKLVHRLKTKNPAKTFEGDNLADFCEVVVTKAEPLDNSVQSRNDDVGVPNKLNGQPSVDLSGYSCTQCGKKMKTLLSLKRHMNWHTNVGNNLENKIECFVCKETFRFQSHYRLHMRGHYDDPNLDPVHLTCTICNRRSKHLRAAKAHMNFHKQTRFQNKDYQCSICKRVFQFRKLYLSHMAIHFKRGDSAHSAVVGYKNVNEEVKPASEFSCHLCGKACDSAASLKCHVAWHSSKTNLYGNRHECHICHVQFTNKMRLKNHIKAHYEDENGEFKCPICGKGFIEEEYCQRHVKGHNFDHSSHKKRLEKLRKGKVICPICSRYYPDLLHLIRHLRRTHPESKMIKQDPDAPEPTYYPCKLCAKVFLTEKRLQNHEERHMRKPDFIKCKFCGKNSFSWRFHNVHIKGHLYKVLDEPMKCPHCSESFVKALFLHQHLKQVHDIQETWAIERTNKVFIGPLKELQCSVCLKELASRGNFERHLDYHNSLRCNYCFDVFNTMKFLEGHLAFHCDKKKLIGNTEVYPKKIKCQSCFKPFHLQVKLDCHLRIRHDIIVNREATQGRMDHVCDFCFRVFENADSLAGHKLYHRTVGFYGCLYCPRKFNSMTTYNKHKNHHYSMLYPDDPRKCEHCDEKFYAFREMIDHMKDVHGDDKDWVTLPKESVEETCHICNKTFYNLPRHLVYHEENRCRKCGEYFYSRTDLDNHFCHIISDDDDPESSVCEELRREYQECTFCFKPINRTQTKIKHDRQHRSSGSISCRFCTHKFKTIDAFNIHAFSHRSKKYTKKPIKCRICREKFIKYGVFMKHMANVHKSKKKVHYRTMVRPEPCVVCGDDFPNLHNHYRAHLANRCQSCKKYFTSSKLFSQHECDKEDADPSKVFACDANLFDLINSYVPKDDKDDEKFYGYTDDEEDEETEETGKTGEQTQEQDTLTPKLEGFYTEESQTSQISQNSQNSQNSQISNENEHLVEKSFVISDILSLSNKKKSNDCNDPDVNIVSLSDDDMEIDSNVPFTITIDD